MARAFCTIFNSVYLVRGLALRESLARHCPDYRLYAFAMDALTAEVLRAENDPRLVVVTPAEFEGAALLAVKPSRSVAEYFWTCTPSILWYCLTVRGEPECTYLDADLWLMADPAPLFEETGRAAVLLTLHRYAPRFDTSAAHGRYCVQFMRFVANAEGLNALEWWRDRCLEWCSAVPDGKRFGDQKYLDDWQVRFPGVHVLRHRGGGVAPWNLERYQLRGGPAGPEVRERDGAWVPLVFFHFHSLRSLGDTVILADGYPVSELARSLIYLPYLERLEAQFQRVRPSLSGLAADGVAPGASGAFSGVVGFLKRLRALPNTFALSTLRARR